MGCNCGSKGAKQQYEVTTKTGEVKVVNSRTEALAVQRTEGGTFRPKSS